MLRQRLLTAALLIPLVVWAVWHLSPLPFALALAAVVLLAGWEWGALMGAKGFAARGLYPLLLVLLMALVWEFAGHVEIMVGMLAGALIWWMVLAWLLLRAAARPCAGQPTGRGSLSSGGRGVLNPATALQHSRCSYLRRLLRLAKSLQGRLLAVGDPKSVGHADPGSASLGVVLGHVESLAKGGDRILGGAEVAQRVTAKAG